MKLPFGSRRSRQNPPDDLGGFEDGGFEDGEIDVDDLDLHGLAVDDVVDREYPQPERKPGLSFDDAMADFEDHDGVQMAAAPVGSHSVRVPPPVERALRPTDGDGEIDGFTADEFSDQMERLRSEASAEQRSAWAYLGLLTGLFGFLVIFGYGCSDQGESNVATGEFSEVAESGQPARVVLRVDGDIITLEGAVPDEATVVRLVSIAQGAYGTGNVIDELTIDPTFSLDDGTIRTIGSATVTDGRPQSLHDSLGEELGLANRGFEVGFVDVILSPAMTQVAIDEDRVTLSGAVPDQASVDTLVAVAGEVWGPSNVDPSGLSIGQASWEEGRISLSGSVLSSDLRPETFAEVIPDRLGAAVIVDTAGLMVEDVTALLLEVEAEIAELVTANPIQFEPLSAEIQPGSDSVLIDLAALLAQAPDGDFEVVGYTDSVGDDQENLLLSQDRAKAVVDRLAELGVAPERMTSRGEGESNPIADNNTDEGRALNRRIEFVFVGLADLTGDAVVGDTTTTTEG